MAKKKNFVPCCKKTTAIAALFRRKKNRLPWLQPVALNFQRRCFQMCCLVDSSNASQAQPLKDTKGSTDTFPASHHINKKHRSSSAWSRVSCKCYFRTPPQNLSLDTDTSESSPRTEHYYERHKARPATNRKWVRLWTGFQQELLLMVWVIA